MNVKIKDLAKELQLSVATISKAMKDSHEISAETKQRVLALAKKLNYTPNPYASSLRKRSSKTIAVVIPEVADTFFSLSINGIESVAQEKGFHVLIYLTHENFFKEESILKDFQNGRVDGVLMSVSSETANHRHILELFNTEMPLVFFDRVCEDIHTAKVVTNDFESGYKATRHLLEKGCKRLGFLCMGENLSIINDRLEGFKKSISDAGLDQKNHFIINCPADEGQSHKSIKKILSGKKKPDGFVASVEKLAMTAYNVCKEEGLSIPHDVKVVAFSNLQIASLLNPSLTTITQPAFEMGKAAATILFKALEKSRYNLKDERVVIESVLMERDSTK
ncbi:MAG: LacI family DNA-binding transcriptional regulator [Chitinophagaceae bacterium]